ncbi:MAG: DUF1016 domain-containing protein [Bacteroidales bacterium]|nr:DUF1016 domain-containing protein [Bacteroidales bacterium]
MFENRQLPIDDFNEVKVNELEIRQMAFAEFNEQDMEAFLNVSFTIHHLILTKTKTFEERMFYIRRCATEFWSYLKTVSFQRTEQKHI